MLISYVMLLWKSADICHNYVLYVYHMFPRKLQFFGKFLNFQTVPISYVFVICHIFLTCFSYAAHMFVICCLPSSVYLVQQKFSQKLFLSCLIHPGLEGLDQKGDYIFVEKYNLWEPYFLFHYYYFGQKGVIQNSTH